MMNTEFQQKERTGVRNPVRFFVSLGLPSRCRRRVCAAREAPALPFSLDPLTFPDA